MVLRALTIRLVPHRTGRARRNHRAGSSEVNRQTSVIQQRDQARGIEDGEANRDHHQQRVDPASRAVEAAQQRFAIMLGEKLQHGAGVFL